MGTKSICKFVEADIVKYKLQTHHRPVCLRNEQESPRMGNNGIQFSTPSAGPLSEISSRTGANEIWAQQSFASGKQNNSPRMYVAAAAAAGDNNREREREGLARQCRN